MKYGDLPNNLGLFDVQCNEMMFIQYMPIKLASDAALTYDDRFCVFNEIINKINEDFINAFGYNEWCKSYVYLTVKHMYQVPNASFNRHGYHSDGFLTNDINYIWSNMFPTVFNTTKFNLTLDDRISIGEMEEQAITENEITYPNKTLLRLNEYNIHKVGNNSTGGLRTFIKVSFSKDKYDLIGNAHNYLLPYDWEMKERSVDRNIPQTLIQKEVFQFEDEWVDIIDIGICEYILSAANKIEPDRTLNTLETFEADYFIDEDYYKISYKVKSNEKPIIKQLIKL